MLRSSEWSSLALSLVLGIGCATDPCADVEGRLAGAAAGDTVELGACTIEGAWTVPAGVTLAGLGADQTTIVTPDGAAGLSLESGATLRGVRVEGASLPLVAGEGAVVVEDVELVAARGVGMRLVGDGASLSRVSIVGPVTAANATMVPVGAGSDVTATHGLVLANAGSATDPVRLEDVSVDGFAGFGVLAIDADVTWEGGGASHNLGLGLRVAGGAMRLSDVEVRETLQGVQPGLTFGAAFTDAAVESAGLAVHDTEGLGVLHDGGTATHLALVGAGNRDAGLWVQRAEALTVEDGELSDNRLAGLFVAETASVRVARARIEGTTTATRSIDGTVGRVEVGDGLHAILEDGRELTMEEIQLVDNARAGALLDVAVDRVDASVTDVSVDGPAEAFGVVAQRDEAPVSLGGLDAQITRSGGPALNDASFGGLPVLGIIGPMFLPPSE